MLQDTNTKDSFIKAGKAIDRKRPVMTPGDAPIESLPKLLLYGSDGTGKTSMIRGLLENGLKVIVLSTDYGGSGTNSVKMDLRRIGKGELLSNMREIALEEFDDISDFLESPELFCSDIWDWADGDVYLFWDGVSFWQSMPVLEYVGMNAIAKTQNDAQSEGYSIDQQGWGQVKNITLRQINKALTMKNKKTGKDIGKILTCALKMESKEGRMNEVSTPSMTGAGGQYFKHGLDLIVHTRIRSERDATSDDGKKRVYEYVLTGSGITVAKSRGYKFDSILAADPITFIKDLLDQHRGQTIKK